MPKNPLNYILKIFWVTTKINEKYNNSAINMNLSLKTLQKLNSGLFFSLSGQKIAPENFQNII